MMLRIYLMGFFGTRVWIYRKCLILKDLWRRSRRCGRDWHDGCEKLNNTDTNLPGATPMSSEPRTTQPQADEMPRDMQELLTAIEALPAEHRNNLEPMARRVAESTKRRRRILNLVQEALSQLRLDMKYLVFDLEATRRERDELRERLDGDQ